MEKEKILIVDDNKINRSLLKAILGDDYEYIEADDGALATKILSNNHDIDLMLLDLCMPNMDGLAVLKYMNEKRFIRHIPVLIISADNEDNVIDKCFELGAIDFILRPFNNRLVKNRVKNTLYYADNHRNLVKLFKNQVLEREKSSNAMINIFSNIIELRNSESGTHTLHVQNITNLLLHELVSISDKYELSEVDISRISSLAALHDVGKIMIPESVLNKPGKLTSDEWDIMKKHTIYGYEIMCNSNVEADSVFMKTAKEIVRWHHEKYDGKGYPDGLIGDDIPISAQAVSIADVYDALTSERCYKKAFSHEDAIKMIINGECGVFNPILITCLKNIADELKKLVVSKKIDTTNSLNDAMHITNELLSENKLGNDSVSSYFDVYQAKVRFFDEFGTKGILFEYDVLTQKGRVINSYLPKGQRIIEFFSDDKNLKILSESDWLKYFTCLNKTTRDNPSFELKVELNINGKIVPHNLYVETVWPKKGSSFVTILGQYINSNEDL